MSVHINYVCVYMSTCLYMYVCVCVHVCMHICVHVCVCVQVCVYVHVCAHVHLHVCVCVCVNTGARYLKKVSFNEGLYLAYIIQICHEPSRVLV